MAIILLVQFPLFSQETTFHRNGPDDYREGVHAFMHATIFKTYNSKIEDATLLIRDGKVVEAGANVAIPKGAIVHDMKGKFIYPSFIDIYSSYGLPDPKKQGGNGGPQMETNIKGAYGWNQAIHADYSAVKSFMADDKKADELRKLGFGTVLTHNKDGIARGTGAVVTLANDKENNLVIRAEASAHYSFNKGTSTQDYPESLMGIIALLRQTYYDADWYKNLKEKKEYNLSLEAWNNTQSLPQIFDATHDWQNILRADKIGREFGVQYIIKGDGTRRCHGRPPARPVRCAAGPIRRPPCPGWPPPGPQTSACRSGSPAPPAPAGPAGADGRSGAAGRERRWPATARPPPAAARADPPARR